MSELAGKNLLIVDDDVIPAAVTADKLRRQGMAVTIVSTGSAAIELARTAPVPDLILMDIDLGPGIDGAEAASQILGERDIPIVFMSSHSEPSIVDRTDRITSYGYVSKLSSEIILTTSLKMALRLHRMTKRERQQRETLETVLNNIPVMIAFLDDEGRHLFVNRHWQEVLGWSLAEVRSVDILCALYPDPSYREEVVRFITRADAGWADFRTRCRDGSILDTSWANVRLSDGSNIGIGLDITERIRAEREIARLNAHTLALQEAERRRIAKDLHDGVSQMIQAALINFTAYHADQAGSVPRFESGMKSLQSAAREIREIYSNLYPSTLEDLGLAAAVRAHARTMLQGAGVETTVAIPDELELPGEIAINVYRILQEACANILKHAGARHTDISLLTEGDQVRLEVRDDGVGIPDDQIARGSGGFGLASIRQRAAVLGGTLSIVPGNPGTVLTIRFPLEAPYG